MILVNHQKCMLSLKEKMLIEEYLRKGNIERALDILRATWAFVMRYDPKHKDASTILASIQELVHSIKSGDYVNHLPEKKDEESYREMMFWDWVCDVYACNNDNNLFVCESPEEAEFFHREYTKHASSKEYHLLIIRDKELNIYKTKYRSLPSQSDQQPPSEPQKC